MITIEWNRPAEYGDGFISEYHLKVDYPSVGKFSNQILAKDYFDYFQS